MKKIILVDNHSEDIKLLIKLLNENYIAFTKEYNRIPGVTKLASKTPPPIEGFCYDESSDANNRIQGRYIYDYEKKSVDNTLTAFHGSEDEFIKMLNSDSYCLLDVCLVSEEEKDHLIGSISKNDFERTTGYKLAQKIKSTMQKIKVSMISRIFPPLENSCNEISIIAKPFCKKTRRTYETQAPEIDDGERAGNIYVAFLPKELWTNKPDEAFSNIVFYNFFKKCGLTK